MDGDMDPGVVRNADHRSGDLQLLATLSESENLKAWPGFVFRIKCAFADLKFDCDFASGQDTRRALICVRCNAW
jgi:hypothetical protein